MPASEGRRCRRSRLGLIHAGRGRNLFEVEADDAGVTQGSSRTRNPGWRAQSLRDWPNCLPLSPLETAALRFPTKAPSPAQNLKLILTYRQSGSSTPAPLTRE